MSKLSTTLLTGAKRLQTFCLNQRIKSLESSRESWKLKAMRRLDEIRNLKRELEQTQAELKKNDDQ